MRTGGGSSRTPPTATGMPGCAAVPPVGKTGHAPGLQRSRADRTAHRGGFAGRALPRLLRIGVSGSTLGPPLDIPTHPVPFAGRGTGHLRRRCGGASGTGTAVTERTSRRPSTSRRSRKSSPSPRTSRTGPCGTALAASETWSWSASISATRPDSGAACRRRRRRATGGGRRSAAPTLHAGVVDAVTHAKRHREVHRGDARAGESSPRGGQAAAVAYTGTRPSPIST